MTFCPSCGFNLSRDELIERDGFVIDPRGGVTFEGRQIEIWPSEVSIAHTVATAAGRCVSIGAIAGRLDSEAIDPINRIAVSICRMRKRFAAANAPFPIETVHSRGYRWEMPA
jgi:DNA-binding response OmpR family regulator